MGWLSGTTPCWVRAARAKLGLLLQNYVVVLFWCPPLCLLFCAPLFSVSLEASAPLETCVSCVQALSRASAFRIKVCRFIHGCSARTNCAFNVGSCLFRAVRCIFIFCLFFFLQTWCPKCAALRSVERKKLTIAEMHQTARQFGGVFLSPEYHGAAVKVR